MPLTLHIDANFKSANLKTYLNLDMLPCISYLWLDCLHLLCMIMVMLSKLMLLVLDCSSQNKIQLYYAHMLLLARKPCLENRMSEFFLWAPCFGFVPSCIFICVLPATRAGLLIYLSDSQISLCSCDSRSQGFESCAKPLCPIITCSQLS